MTQEVQTMNSSWKIEDEGKFKQFLDKAELKPIETEVFETVLLGEPEKLKKMAKITKTVLGQLLRKTVMATGLISEIAPKPGGSEEEEKEKADEKIKKALEEATKQSGDGGSVLTQQGGTQVTPEDEEDDEEEDEETKEGKKDLEKVCTDYKSARGCRFQKFPECGKGSHPKVCLKYENGVRTGKSACEDPCPKGLYHKPICRFGRRCLYKKSCFDWHPPKAEKDNKEREKEKERKEKEEKERKEKEEKEKKERKEKEEGKKKDEKTFLEEHEEMKKTLEELKKRKTVPGTRPFIYPWSPLPEESDLPLIFPMDPFPNRDPGRDPRCPQGRGIIQGSLPWHQGWQGPPQPPWAYRTGPWAGNPGMYPPTY